MVNATLHRKLEVNGGLIAGKFTTGKFGKQGSSPLFLDYNGCEPCCRLIMRYDKMGTTPKLECTTFTTNLESCLKSARRIMMRIKLKNVLLDLEWCTIITVLPKKWIWSHYPSV